MITTDRDRKLKVGKAIKNERQNILCYLSTPACTCTINCLHAWPPDSSSMIYMQYIHGELKSRDLCWICLELYWQVASNNMVRLIYTCWSSLLFTSSILERLLQWSQHSAILFNYLFSWGWWFSLHYSRYRILWLPPCDKTLMLWLFCRFQIQNEIFSTVEQAPGDYHRLDIVTILKFKMRQRQICNYTIYVVSP